MHIGLLTSDLSHRHGWAHHSLSLLLALRRAGVRLTVVTARNSPDVDGVDLYRLLPNTYPAERGLLLKSHLYAPRIAHVLRGCDLIHSTIEPYAPAGARVAGPRPLLQTAHGSYIPLLIGRRWPAGALYQAAFNAAARIVCVSGYTARVIESALPGVRTAVIPNGVDVERFADLPPLDTPKRGPTVLSVGAVKARKGTLELVRAMVVVRQRIPDVQAVMIGSLDAEPGYTAQVQTAIDDLGLGDCVTLAGHVPESTLLAWYGAADVFVLPSRNIGGKFEGYGIVHLEASAAGLPVIGTTDNGAEDAIAHGETGLLVAQDDIDNALPGAIIDLLRDKDQAARMGAAGRLRAQAQTWDTIAARTIALYEQVLAT